MSHLKLSDSPAENIAINAAYVEVRFPATQPYTAINLKLDYKNNNTSFSA